MGLSGSSRKPIDISLRPKASFGSISFCPRPVGCLLFPSIFGIEGP